MLRLLSLGMRAVQVLAAAGVASKRACEALMTEGAVEVNGTVITQQGTFVNPRRDTITVRGEKIAVAKVGGYVRIRWPAVGAHEKADPA